MMKNRTFFPSAAGLIALLLCILAATLFGCTEEPADRPAHTNGTVQSDSAWRPADLIGSWMDATGGQMRIYTFRSKGELTVYEMESATKVRERRSGNYLLTDDRLTLEIDGQTLRFSILLEPGRALILDDGRILTPVGEPTAP